MDRFSFQLGGLVIHYYGLILCAAILAAYLVARKQSWRFGISTQEVDKFTFWLVIVSFIGARLYYVLFNLSYFSQNWLDIFKVWEGGISIFGALIMGAIWTYFFARHKAYSFWQLLDLTALVLPLGQAIGRLGNYVNYEAFGTPTDLPWKIYVPIEHRPAEFLDQAYFHPTFLYEAVANLILFALLLLFRKKLRYGSLALSYIIGYSIIRFCIEFLRTDVFWVGGVNGNQFMALFLLALASGVLVWRMRAKMV